MAQIEIPDGAFKLRPVRGIVATELQRRQDAFQAKLRVCHGRGWRKRRTGSALQGRRPLRSRSRQVVLGLVKRWIEGQGALEVATGLFVMPQRQFRITEPVERVREIAPDRERALEAAHGRRVLSALQQHDPQIRVRFRQCRIESQRGFELRDGKVGFTETPVGDRQMAAIDRLAGVKLDRSDQQLLSASGTSQLQSENSGGVKRLGVARERGLQCFERSFRSAAFSRLKRLERLGDQSSVKASPGSLQGGGQSPFLLTHRTGPFGNSLGKMYGTPQTIIWKSRGVEYRVFGDGGQPSGPAARTCIAATRGLFTGSFISKPLAGSPFRTNRPAHPSFRP